MYLAVDDGRCKQADIVKAIASQLQDGSVVNMDTPQCVLIQQQVSQRVKCN